jgi:peptide/nickel transport system substrate-binding protein
MIPYRWRAVLATVALLLTLVPAASAAPDNQAADRASVLKIAIGHQVQDPTNLNIYAPSVSRSDTGIHQLVYEYFFYYNLQTGEFVPWLAENYKYNADFTALDVKLRDGVTWNDGEPFNADDVTFTYDLLKNNPGMVWADITNTNVDSVEKLDNLNVRFHLKTANPHFHLIREAFPAVGIWGGITILPKHIWQGKDPLTFKASPPVGTGPYKLQDASSTALTYVRNDNWWGNKVFGVLPAPKQVQFVYEGTETNAALALANNDLDTPNIGILGLGTFLNVAQRNAKVSRGKARHRMRGSIRARACLWFKMPIHRWTTRPSAGQSRMRSTATHWSILRMKVRRCRRGASGRSTTRTSRTSMRSATCVRSIRLTSSTWTRPTACSAALA